MRCGGQGNDSRFSEVVHLHHRSVDSTTHSHALHFPRSTLSTFNGLNLDPTVGGGQIDANPPIIPVHQPMVECIRCDHESGSVQADLSMTRRRGGVTQISP
jgi:hypothetical protein